LHALISSLIKVGITMSLGLSSKLVTLRPNPNTTKKWYIPYINGLKSFFLKHWDFNSEPIYGFIYVLRHWGKQLDGLFI
jgi:hypothetical protein